jgi:outer membrane protein assembly factor BamD
MDILFNFNNGKHLRWIFLIVVTSMVLDGCAASDELQQLTADERFKIAVEKFTNGDYLEAIEDFKIVTLQFQGSGLADDAQFYVAECYFMREQYLLAAYEYEALTRTMPTSEFVSQARYRKALCYYLSSPASYLDQENTRKAIDEFQTFIEYHPTDSLVPGAEAKIGELHAKLARKEFENGMIYMKMEYYRAAINSFEHVLEKYYDSPYAEHSQLKKAEAMYYRNRLDEARVELEKFFLKYPQSSLKAEAEQLQRYILQKQEDKAPNAATEQSNKQQSQLLRSQ